MTLTVNDTVADAAAPVPRRRRWPWVVVLIVVIALVGTGISAVVYAHTYSPLGPGNYGIGPSGHVRAVTDGISNPTRYIVVGPRGSQGVVTYSVRNNGNHPVRILGTDVQRDTFLYGLISVTWSPTIGANRNTIDARVKGSRPFPVTLDPDQEISLYVKVTKPGCEAGFSEEIGGIPLRTESLWVHHVWELPLSIQSGISIFPPIDVCSPKSALVHISKS